ncbi:RNA polymerase sigma factor [Nesterenkonia sp. HG001]|uniref:RNA polymerase sigma factor n=1 Tax=Nesterenkonia sp. HG001 TaxID=2983207 RepID=UPI002ACC350A|nr:sigma-70 family RNA polymerase sigma factor [Nesterenkonia sp. HG001]
MYHEPMRSSHASRPPASRDVGTAVARAQDGDVQAFEELLDMYEAPLLRLAVRMLRDRSEAEDIVQDTFLTVWRRLHTLEDVEKFKTWIYRLTSNACIDVIRRRERQRTTATDPSDLVTVVSSESSLEDATERGEALRHLESVLVTLPAEQRLAWLLFEIEGQSYAEIAAVMDSTEGSVRGRIHRARAAIVRGMEGWA